LAAVAGINDTGDQLASRVIDNDGAPKLAKISVNFLNKFILPGAWGKTLSKEKGRAVLYRDFVTNL
jgi:hypothetical protein